MKGLKTGFTLLALFAMVTFANAQTAKEESPQEKTERYIKALNLSEEQANEARDLNAKYIELINAAATADEKRNYVNEHEGKVKELLTEDQYAKYKEMVAKERRQEAVLQKQRSSK